MTGGAEGRRLWFGDAPLTDPSGHSALDTGGDVSFSAYDLQSLACGPGKDREGGRKLPVDQQQLNHGIRCAFAALGALTVWESATVLAAGGLALQGVSITFLGLSLGASAPVTAAGVTAGLFLEVAAVAGYGAGVYLIQQVCLEGH